MITAAAAAAGEAVLDGAGTISLTNSEPYIKEAIITLIWSFSDHATQLSRSASQNTIRCRTCFSRSVWCATLIGVSPVQVI